MDSLVIKNGTVVTMNSKREIVRSDVLIRGNRIVDVRPEIHCPGARVLDARGKVIIPGLIQTHIHLTQTLFRGLADDLELLDWLKRRVWPLEAAHTWESNFLSAKLGAAELIKGGTTTCVDMETVRYTDAAFEAVQEAGCRAIIGKCMMDHGKGVPPALMEDTEESIVESERLLVKWHGKAGGRLQYAFAPRFAVSCTERLLKRVGTLARDYQVMVHTHASENLGEVDLISRERGMTNIHYLHSVGLTGEEILLAHCIWLDDEEFRILADTGTQVAHCPNSNMKLASGIAKVPEMQEARINVTLGADGAPCNNNLDMFREMRAAALIQKARLLNSTAMPAAQVFEMATLGGARAVGMESHLGSIEPGKLADIAILDLSGLHAAPLPEENLVSTLVYSASAVDVETTIVDGRILMQDRQLKTINEQAVVRESERIVRDQLARAGLPAQMWAQDKP